MKSIRIDQSSPFCILRHPQDLIYGVAMSSLNFLPMVLSLGGEGVVFPGNFFFLSFFFWSSHDLQSSEPSSRNVCVPYISFLTREPGPLKDVSVWKTEVN